MRSPHRRTILLILLGFAGLFAFRQVRVHGINNPEKALTLPPQSNQRSSTPSMREARPLLRGRFSSKSRQEMRKCFPETSKTLLAASQTLADFSVWILHEHGNIQSEELQWKNIHIRLPNGEIRRIRLDKSSGDGSGGEGELTLHIFREDEQGFPFPVEIPAQDSFHPTKEVIDFYLSQGQQIYELQSSRLIYGDSSEAELTLENGAVASIHFMSSSRSIGCDIERETHEIDCKCIRSPR
jgi:hypothetical protein